MSGLLLWDVDTQVDFVHAAGKLPVPGAEAAAPAMARLVCWAGERGVTHLATADDHELTDPEISDAPDFESTTRRTASAAPPVRRGLPRLLSTTRCRSR